MSWITFIWSMTAGICLTLGAVHLLVWSRQRDQWANLVFAICAAAAAGYAVFDMLAMHAQTPAEYGQWSRWTLVMGMIEGVSVVCFIRLYLRAGRLWLLGLICGVRALMLVLNFVPGPNFFFREITGLQPMPLLGDLIARPLGVLHPWAILMPPSFLLIILFVIDATRTASRQSGERRAWVLGGVTAVGFTVVLVFYALYARGVLPSAFTSQLTLLLIVVMGYELSRDVLRAAQLSRELLESQHRMRLAASAADLSLWEWDTVRDEIWVTEKGRERAGVGASERIDFGRFLQSLHPDDREPTRRAVRQSLDAGGDFEAEYRVMARDGAARWVIARGQVERSADGKPLRLRGVTVDITARKLAEEAAHNLSGRLIHAQEETQRQLAGELHDDLSQSLALLSVELEMFGQNPPAEPQKIATRMEEFSTQVKGLSSEVHRLSHALHPAKLDQLGLAAAVRGFCKEFALAHEIAVEFTEHDVPREVSADAALCLYRIAQEALHNVVKHSGGTAAKVELTRADGHLRLVVTDDGAGFDAQATRMNGSLGLVSMNERARFVGGQFTLESHPGTGTRVEVRVPIAAAEEPTPQ